MASGSPIEYTPLHEASTGATAPITIYAMPGSQFSAKVICGLDSRGIQHYVKFVDADPEKRKKQLPSGGLLVPEMQYSTSIVPDSDKIFRFLDENLKTNFFPQSLPEVEALCSKACVTLNAYERSMRALFIRVLPGFLCCCRGPIIDRLVANKRKELQVEVQQKLGLDPKLIDEPQMYKGLVQLLSEFQTHLHTDAQKYLVASTSEPTAADCALYAMVERLVGSVGDAEVPSALPQLYQETSLARLWKWHQLMVEKHPIQFKGKKPPK
eukprot:gnl/MRDRNA2_/MRDRNA2_71317_c0_seq1.p1 gnl/MRDRNA2_/MRDRNA2_71317_c0~~gnl/MRDRNA2_/MRDRNA2_71317_c0_seq1.p1  ORF type:complete len:268 (+),score=49.61 gnl/MRDRNA2_/MRDRNA2_71317_c0_seq1:151-954(+)